MPFEYAASYPREAEQSLKWLRERASRYLSLLRGERRLLQQITIEAEPASDSMGAGYQWEIVIAPDLQQLLAQKARAAVLRKIPADLLSEKDWLNYFQELVRLESHEEGDSREWEIAYDSAGEEIFELRSSAQVRPLETIPCEISPAFREFQLARRFLFL